MSKCVILYFIEFYILETVVLTLSLLNSALGLFASLLLIAVCSVADKRSGVDKHRLIISIAGIFAMMCLFFLLVNLLVVNGLL